MPCKLCIATPAQVHPVPHAHGGAVLQHAVACAPLRPHTRIRALCDLARAPRVSDSHTTAPWPPSPPHVVVDRGLWMCAARAGSRRSNSHLVLSISSRNCKGACNLRCRIEMLPALSRRMHRGSGGPGGRVDARSRTPPSATQVLTLRTALAGNPQRPTAAMTGTHPSLSERRARRAHQALNSSICGGAAN